jgi:PAS domain S-box-containing protein
MTRASQTMRIDIPPDLREELRLHDRKRRPLAEPPPPPAPSAPTPCSTALGDTDFQELFQSVYDGAVIADYDGHIVDANTRAVDFLQYSRAELSALNITALISGADAATLKTLTASIDEDRFVLIQAYCVRKDGVLFPAEIAVNSLAVRKRRYLCCFIRDLSWRRQAEEMLRTVHNAIQNAATGIAIADLEGNIDYANLATARLWEFDKADDLTNRRLSDLITDPAILTALRDSVARGESWTGALAIKRPAGPPLHVQVAAAENRNSDDQIVGMVLSFLDISDRKRAEEAEKHAERQRVMVESLGTACHHLGQPATVLLASLELMSRMRAVDPGKSDELLSSSIEAAEAMRKMLHDLNQMAEYRTTSYIEGRDEFGYSNVRILDFKPSN